MESRKITIQKSDNPKHKYQALIQDGSKTKIIRFGGIKKTGQAYEDYTIHNDKERMQRYTQRHIKEIDNWKFNTENIYKPSFWSKQLLWNDSTSNMKTAVKLIENGLRIPVKIDI